MTRWAAMAAASTASLTSDGRRRTPPRELHVRPRVAEKLIELRTSAGEVIGQVSPDAVGALRLSMHDARVLLSVPYPQWPEASPESRPAPAVSRVATPTLHARPLPAQDAVGLYRGDTVLHTVSPGGCAQAELDLRYVGNQFFPLAAGSAPVSASARRPTPTRVA